MRHPPPSWAFSSSASGHCGAADHGAGHQHGTRADDGAGVDMTARLVPDLHPLFAQIAQGGAADTVGKPVEFGRIIDGLDAVELCAGAAAGQKKPAERKILLVQRSHQFITAHLACAGRTHFVAFAG